MRLRNLVIVFLLLSLVMPVFAHEETELTETYTRGNFSMSYPDGWSVDDEQLEDQVVFSSFPDTNFQFDDSLLSGQMQLAIALPESMAQIGLAQNADPAVVMESLTPFLFEGGEFESINTVSVGNGEGVRADGLNAEGAHLTVFALSYGETYTIAVLTIIPEEDFEDREHVMLDMLASIAFSDLAQDVPAPESTDEPDTATLGPAGETAPETTLEPAPEATDEPSTSVGMPPPLSQTYVGEGFTFDYPVGWVIGNEEAGLQVEIASIEDARLSMNFDFPPGEYGIAFALPTVMEQIGLTTDAAAEDVMAVLAETFLDIEPDALELEDLTINDNRAVLAQNDRSIAIVFETASGTVAVGGQTAPGFTDQLEILMLQVLDTFAFTDASDVDADMGDSDEAAATEETPTDASTDDASSDELQTYAGSGIAFDYPAGWFVTNEDLGIGVEVSSIEDGRLSANFDFPAGEYGIAFALPGAFEPEPGTGTSPEDVLAILKSSFLQLPPEDETFEEFEFDGNRAISARNEQAIVIVFESDLGTVAMGGQTSPGNIDALETLMRDVLETVRFGEVSMDQPDAMPTMASLPTLEFEPTPVPQPDEAAVEQIILALDATYIDEDSGFTMMYPDGWFVDESAMPVQVSIASGEFSVNEIAYESGEIALGVAFEPAIEGIGLSLESSPEDVATTVQTLAREAPSDEVIPVTDVEAVMYGGVEGWQFIERRENSEIVLIAMRIDGRLLALGVRTAAGELAQYDTFINDVIASMSYSDTDTDTDTDASDDAAAEVEEVDVPDMTEESTGTIGDIEGVIVNLDVSRAHVDTPEYADDGLPPAGGEHKAAWQNCGVYDTVIDTGNAVHSLEHGVVWLTYNPDDLDADAITMLQEKMSQGTHRLMSPFPDQRSPIVLTGWGVQLELDDADDTRIDQFIAKYEKGEQSPEPGASCRNGVGSPIR